MPFMIERLVRVYTVKDGEQRLWRAVRPAASANPYVWQTRHEAEAMMGLFYNHSGQKNGVRVTEVAYVCSS